MSDPIIPDKLAYRFAEAYNSRDGLSENTFLNESINGQSSLGGRANILWTPSLEWSIFFNANGTSTLRNQVKRQKAKERRLIF